MVRVEGGAVRRYYFVQRYSFVISRRRSFFFFFRRVAEVLWFQGAVRIVKGEPFSARRDRFGQAPEHFRHSNDLVVLPRARENRKAEEHLGGNRTEAAPSEPRIEWNNVSLVVDSSHIARSLAHLQTSIWRS